MRLSTNFKSTEFACHGTHCCGGSSPIDSRLIDALQAYRTLDGHSMRINSGFRCLRHNRDIGSKDTSQHPKGKACDIAKGDRDVYTMAMAAKPFFSKVIVYDWGIHCDVR